jgi:hypothetical protein
LEEIGVESRIILKGILKKWAVREWTGLKWLRFGTSGALVNKVMNRWDFMSR